MQCDKCSSNTMEKKKLFRSSGCLVVVGIVLLLISLLMLIIGGFFGLLGPRVNSKSYARYNKENKAKTISSLKNIPGLPDTLIKKLESTDRVSEKTLLQLPFEKRQRVRSVLLDYYGKRLSNKAASGVFVGIGTFFVLLLFAFGIPGLIIGLLLVRRKKVWRCANCGFTFERA